MGRAGWMRSERPLWFCQTWSFGLTESKHRWTLDARSKRRVFHFYRKPPFLRILWPGLRWTVYCPHHHHVKKRLALQSCKSQHLLSHHHSHWCLLRQDLPYKACKFLSSVPGQTSHKCRWCRCHRCQSVTLWLPAKFSGWICCQTRWTGAGSWQSLSTQRKANSCWKLWCSKTCRRM